MQRSGIGKALRLEIMVAAPDPDGRLAGCGLVMVNPPWRLQSEAEIVLGALSGVLARGARSVAIDWVAGGGDNQSVSSAPG